MFRLGLIALPCALLVVAGLALAQSRHSYPRMVIKDYRTLAVVTDGLSDEANKLGMSSHGLRTLLGIRLRFAGIDVTEREDGAAMYVNVDVSGPAYHVRVSMLRQVTYNVRGEQRTTLAETWYDETMGVHNGDREAIEAAVLAAADGFVEEYLRVNGEYARPRN